MATIHDVKHGYEGTDRKVRIIFTSGGTSETIFTGLGVVEHCEIQPVDSQDNNYGISLNSKTIGGAEDDPGWVTFAFLTAAAKMQLVARGH